MTNKLPLNHDRFYEALKYKGVSIDQLALIVDRNKRTLYRYLKEESIPEDVLEDIARVLDVHPDFLSGVYDRKAAQMDDRLLRLLYLYYVTPEKKPYLLKLQEDLHYPIYFENILAMNGISMAQFKELEVKERIQFRWELSLSILKTIQQHFTTDRFGRKISERTQYCESELEDCKSSELGYDPTSYYAELEGITVDYYSVAEENASEPTKSFWKEKTDKENK